MFCGNCKKVIGVETNKNKKLLLDVNGVVYFCFISIMLNKCAIFIRKV